MVMRLSPAERDAVTAAVTAAETRTDGEIATVITDASDAYHDVALHYAIMAMLLVTALAAIRPNWLPFGATDWDGRPQLFGLLVAQTIAFLLVRLLLAWRPLRLALTPRATKARRVRRQAVRAFRLGTEHRTVARAGVLLYLSTDERMAEIVADRAVHAAVPPERWGEVMAVLVDAVRDGRTGEGLVAATAQIGTILIDAFPKTGSDPDELPDRLIQL